MGIKWVIFKPFKTLVPVNRALCVQNSPTTNTFKLLNALCLLFDYLYFHFRKRDPIQKLSCVI